MIRIRRITDYASVLLAYMFKNMNKNISAKLLSKQTSIPMPTVSKVLKILAKKQLVSSQRGINGGYKILRKPEDISVAEIINALEGPIAITKCASNGKMVCSIGSSCPVRGLWKEINNVVNIALKKLSLAKIVSSFEKF